MGGLTVGALMNQLWSVAIQEDRQSFSQMFLQPFVAYTLKTHTTFTLTSEMSANWNNTPGDAKWTIPLVLSISQVLKIGRQPISIAIGGKYYADSPRYGPDWVCASLSPFSTQPLDLQKRSTAEGFQNDRPQRSNQNQHEK
jgi:hypothetical protein